MSSNGHGIPPSSPYTMITTEGSNSATSPTGATGTNPTNTIDVESTVPGEDPLSISEDYDYFVEHVTNAILNSPNNMATDEDIYLFCRNLKLDHPDDATIPLIRCSVQSVLTTSPRFVRESQTDQITGCVYSVWGLHALAEENRVEQQQNISRGIGQSNSLWAGCHVQESNPSISTTAGVTIDVVSTNTRRNRLPNQDQISSSSNWLVEEVAFAIHNCLFHMATPREILWSLLDDPTLAERSNGATDHLSIDLIQSVLFNNECFDRVVGPERKLPESECLWRICITSETRTWLELQLMREPRLLLEQTFPEIFGSYMVRNNNALGLYPNISMTLTMLGLNPELMGYPTDLPLDLSMPGPSRSGVVGDQREILPYSYLQAINKAVANFPLTGATAEEICRFLAKRFPICRKIDEEEFQIAVDELVKDFGRYDPNKRRRGWNLLKQLLERASSSELDPKHREDLSIYNPDTNQNTVVPTTSSSEKVAHAQTDHNALFEQKSGLVQ